MPNIDKVQSQLQKVVSLTIHNDVKDKTVKLITITGVDLARDLSVATIYYTVMGNDPKKMAVNRALNRAKGFIKSKVASSMKLRRVPDLIFQYDESLAYGNRIEELLKGLKEDK